MPLRYHKYDRPPYPYVYSRQNRRAKKAYYFVERLQEIDPTFKTKVKEITNQLYHGQLNLNQADQQIANEIMQAIKRQQHT
jgi:hypothetical protein